MTSLLLTTISAFCIACALTLFLARARGPLSILDHPNERSLHDTPRPRTGGLAIWAGSLAGAAVLLALWGPAAVSVWIAGAVLIVGAVSLADDRSHVPAALRLAVHLAAAALLMLDGLGLWTLRPPGVEVELGTGAAVIATALTVVWMINLYNFMDGIDGLAAGMAVCGFGTLGLLGAFAGDAGYAALCWAVAAAAGGFLVWNFPPARIFMGDSGASVLGLLAAAMSLWGDNVGLFPFWIALLAFSPFVVDASLTLLRRAFRGERIWEPHRGHYYQRLVQAGWGHRRVVLWGYGLMLLCGAAALFAAHAAPPVQWAILAAVALVYIAAIAGVRRIELGASAPRSSRGQPPPEGHGT